MQQFKVKPERRARIAGFTLLELMLVLAIIGIIGAIATPAVTEVFQRQKVVAAAEGLRIQFEEARLEAMRTGQAQKFQCVPGANNYSVQPLVLQSDVTNAGSGAKVVTASGNLAETSAQGILTAADPTEITGEQLEEGITFASCMVAGDMRAFSVSQDSANNGGDMTTQSIGQTVVFYPDGTTSTAEVRIQNERGDVRAILIRGLTGHSRVVEVASVASSSK